MKHAHVNVVGGTLPLIISIPHLGTYIPPYLRPRMSEAAYAVADTDWHLDQLYGAAVAAGASLVAATVSRYVIDLNRPPDGASLYPGQTTTGLCPLDTFHGEPLYLEGMAPDADEVARRLDTYWRPYHAALAEQIAALRRRHGHVLLWEAHSINGQLPRLFEGTLPDLNLGTADGASCAPAVERAVAGVAALSAYSAVTNGRFKGGYITRHYGDPSKAVHAVQLEMAQRVYMDEHAPYQYRPELAARVQPLLQAMIESALAAARPADHGARG